MDDMKLSLDEARRARQHAEVKADLERQVQTEVNALADRRPAADAADVGRLAAEMRRRAVDDVEVTEREVGRARGLARVSQVVDYAFYLVYALLGTRLLLALLGARPDAAFVQWVNTVSDPLYAPFRNIFPSVTIEEGFTFAVSVSFGMLMYALVHALLKGLLRLVAHRRTAI
jgi:hypothetical protein